MEEERLWPACGKLYCWVNQGKQKMVQDSKSLYYQVMVPKKKMTLQKGEKWRYIALSEMMREPYFFLPETL